MDDVRKNDLVCWVFISPLQKSLYENYLSDDQIEKVFQQEASALIHLNILKKICDHPRLLLSHNLNQNIELETDHSNWVKEFLKQPLHTKHLSSVEDLLSECGKLQFLVDLCNLIVRDGHR